MKAIKVQQREMLHEAELREDLHLEVTYCEVTTPACIEMALSCLHENQNQGKDELTILLSLLLLLNEIMST